VAEILETSRTRKGNLLGNTTQPLKLQERGGRLKLCRCWKDSLTTRHRHVVKFVKFGVLDEAAAEVFALTVFLCDDLLQLKPALTITTASAAATRFFAIASKMPMALQMILCHRAVGSMKQNILRQDSEAAFKSLAGILLSVEI